MRYNDLAQKIDQSGTRGQKWLLKMLSETAV